MAPTTGVFPLGNRKPLKVRGKYSEYDYEDDASESFASDSSHDSDDSDSDGSYVDHSSRKRKSGATSKALRANSTQRKKPRTSDAGSDLPYKASIVILATEELSNQPSDNAPVEEAILARIKKTLALASHEGTPEEEAKAALRKASKLMAQYNVTQAEVMVSEKDSEKLKRAGMSVVAIKSNTNSRVVNETWASHVVNAVTTFFDCKAYSTMHYSHDERLEWSFYGLAEQTVAAAHAFEMVYNQVLVWSKTAVKGRSEKNTYRRGVADGLYRLAKQERNDEEKKTIAKEKARLEAAKTAEGEEEERRLLRLRGPEEAKPDLENPSVKQECEDEDRSGVRVKVEEVEDVDDPLKKPLSLDASYSRKDRGVADEGKVLKDDDAIDASMDIDHDFERALYDDDVYLQADFGSDDDDSEPDINDPVLSAAHEPLMHPSSPPDVLLKKEEEEAHWQSAMQLTQFRQTASTVADDYLKTMEDVKLRKARAAPRLKLANTVQRQIYMKGREDAGKIDVRRQRLKDVEED